ncbi:hypothetical protein [Parabacteroides sp. FAFU027]|uniref:hypothetical protein n=1 Tax=Parabacteroides sp. FAFU027 TaxID=2922715 RepID=UPI001FAED308|nr:hypothetical protein [Parabacteroides sp. FAFU027]
MRKLKLLFVMAFVVLAANAQTIVGGTEDQVSSPTEGVINSSFVSETNMKGDLLQMLANFMTYVKNDYIDAAATNSAGEACGYFKGENSAGSNEQGVRPNADLSMICAFLYKYGKDKVTLPTGVTWDDVNNMARKSLIFAYSTHKANKLKTCAAGDYWGSTSTSDYVWESSLWSMSVAYSAFFQYDQLTAAQKQYVYNLVKSECNYELTRTIPTGFSGDTKAEENGWETNILACALGLYPNDALASQWYDRLRAFAINCYSQFTDVSDVTVIDPEYNTKTVKDLYLGKNLYDDYTLQNHNYFHTSYQNVVMQELGESALALKMFQNGIAGTEKWKTNALMHNNQNVMDKVLNKLALADGELAMPNGNDWSLFLYDQITSYSTIACFLKDPNALMLENVAYKNIKARQGTTTDGSWLLRADVGARRMGVQAHRVMMSWLMHEMASTADVTPTNWTDFRKNHDAAEVFTSQNIVRANTKDRFTCFSWSSGISSYTGYFTQNCPDKNKIVVPYKANNTGNILGWYTVSGKATNAAPVTSGIYNLQGNSYTMNGVINTNDVSLTNNFALYSTPGNALIYLDYVKANSAVTITGARGGLLAISTDDLTKVKRTIYHQNGRYQTDGATTVPFATSWANIDNQIGIVTPGNSSMAFGDRAANNSINTTNFYPLYSAASRTVASGDVVDRRQLIYYSGVSADKTKELAANTIVLKDSLPTGWNGVIATDPDSVRYMLVSNFVGATTADMKPIRLSEGAPVFSVPTDISGGKSTAHFSLATSRSVGNALRVFVTSGDITAQQTADSISALLINTTASPKTIGVMIITGQGKITGNIDVPANSRVVVTAKNGELLASNAPVPQTPSNDITVLALKNASFDASPVTYNVAGTLNTSAVNMWTGAGWTSAYAYNVTDWTNRSIVSSNSTFTATYALGSSATFNSIAVPKTDKSGSSAGACLGASSGWGSGNAVQFTQKVLLPAGNYKMNYDAYNGNTSATTLLANLNGFRNGSATYYDPTTTIAASAWITSSASAYFATPTQCEVSVGASCSSGGSGAGPKLFLDNVRILTDQSVESVESFYWGMARDSAQAAMNRYPTVTSGDLYNNLQTALQQIYTTITECATAIQTLKDATAKFLAGAGIINGVNSVNVNGLEDTPQTVYNVYGQMIGSRKYTKAEALKSLNNGIYIIGHEKVIILSK